MLRRIGKAFLWLGLTGLLCVVTLEVAARKIPLAPDDIPIRYREMPGDEAFAPVPGAVATSLFGVEHRASSLGLRMPERPAPKVPGTYRVAALGDSVTWAYGVPVESGLVAQLEEVLRARPAGGGYEAWNLGLQATNTFNHRARLERLAPIVRPDLTIVLLLHNDLEPAAQHFRITSVGTLSQLGRSAPYPDSFRPYLERSALFHALIRGFGARENAKNQADALALFPRMKEQLDRIAEVCARSGSALALALMPGLAPPPADYDALAARLTAYAARKGVPFVRLSEVLGNPARREFMLPADAYHPNARGHRLIAEALATLVPERWSWSE